MPTGQPPAYLVKRDGRQCDAVEQRTCAIIPVFDHGTTIEQVVEEIRGYELPVVLVDDGSSESCADRLDLLAQRHADIELLRLPRNSGKGVAVLAAARRALVRGFTHGFQIDADGQHDLAAIPVALRRSRCAPEAVVAGKPSFDDSIPGVRLYGRYVTYALVWLNTWSLAIRDPLCGFRIYPLAETVALANRELIRPRMDFDIDVVVRLSWDDVPIACAPVAVRYPVDGISHFDLRRDNLRIARVHAILFCGMLVRLPLLLSRRLARLLGRR